MKVVLFVLELFQEVVILGNFLILVSLKLDVEILRFSIDSSIEVLVIIGKFPLGLIILEPETNLISNFLLVFILALSLFGCRPCFQNHLFVLQADSNALAVPSDVKAQYWRFHFLLVGALECITFIYLQIIVVGR